MLELPPSKHADTQELGFFNQEKFICNRKFPRPPRKYPLCDSEKAGAFVFFFLR